MAQAALLGLIRDLPNDEDGGWRGVVEATRRGFPVETVDKLLQQLDTLPEPYRTTVRNNGGGYVNHK